MGLMAKTEIPATGYWHRRNAPPIPFRVLTVRDGKAHLRCYDAGRTWTQTRRLPLGSNFHPAELTTAELLDLIT